MGRQVGKVNRTGIFWVKETHILKNFIEVYLIYSVVLISATTEITAKWFSYTYAYIYIYKFFFIFSSTMVYHRILNIVPMLYSRSLLLIHPIYNSLHLLTPNSQPFRPPSPPIVNLKSASYVCEPVSQICSLASYCRFYVQAASYGSCFLCLTSFT